MLRENQHIQLILKVFYSLVILFPPYSQQFTIFLAIKDMPPLKFIISSCDGWLSCLSCLVVSFSCFFLSLSAKKQVDFSAWFQLFILFKDSKVSQ